MRPHRRPDCYFTSHIGAVLPGTTRRVWLVDTDGDFWIEPPYVIAGVRHHTMRFASDNWREHLVPTDDGWALNVASIKAWAWFDGHEPAYDGALTARPPPPHPSRGSSRPPEIDLTPWDGTGLSQSEALNAALSMTVPLEKLFERPAGAIELIPRPDGDLIVVPIRREGDEWRRSTDAANLGTDHLASVTSGLAGDFAPADPGFPGDLWRALLGAASTLVVVHNPAGWELAFLRFAEPFLSPAFDPRAVREAVRVAEFAADAPTREVAAGAVAALRRMVPPAPVDARLDQARPPEPTP